MHFAQARPPMSCIPLALQQHHLPCIANFNFRMKISHNVVSFYPTGHVMQYISHRSLKVLYKYSRWPRSIVGWGQTGVPGRTASPSPPVGMGPPHSPLGTVPSELRGGRRQRPNISSHQIPPIPILHAILNRLD